MAAKNEAAALVQTATGGRGQPNVAATIRSNSLSSIVTLPSAAMQAVTAVMTARFTAGLPWASWPKRRPGPQAALFPRQYGRIPRRCSRRPERPLGIPRLALAGVGQRGKDQAGRLGNRRWPIADCRRLLQPEVDVEVAEEHYAEAVFEQVDAGVRRHQCLD